MGASKRAKSSVAEERRGGDVTSLLVVAILGVAVGAALALFPSSEEWNGPPKRDMYGNIVSPDTTIEELYALGDSESLDGDASGHLVKDHSMDDERREVYEKRDQTSGAGSSETALHLTKENVGGAISLNSATAKKDKRYGVGHHGKRPGGAEHVAAIEHAQAGNYEESFQAFVASYLLTTEPELKHRVARNLLLQWKRPCIDMDIEACESPTPRALMQEILSKLDELDLSSDDVFNMAYIHHSWRDHEKALELYVLAEQLAEPNSGPFYSSLTNQAVVGRLLGRADVADAAERRRWAGFELPPTHRSFMESSRCAAAAAFDCKDWSELWEMPSIPEPISRASQLPVRSRVRTLEVRHTNGAPNERLCLPQTDTGHVILNDVSVYGRELWIYDDCSLFSCGLRFAMRPTDDPALRSIMQPGEVVTLDRVAVLPPKHMKNFYHFAVEGMANLVLLLDQVLPSIPNGELPNQKRSLVILVGASSQGDRAFAYETLVLITKVRPDLATVLMWYDVRNRYDIGELHMVDWYLSPDPIEQCPEGVPPLHPSYNGFYAPCELVEKYASILNRAVSRKVPSQDTIVFYSRSTSPRNDRRVVNEELLLTRVKDTIVEFNIEHGTKYRLATHDGSLTVEEQVKLVRRAKVAFGTHGASMSTIVHAQPGAALIEFPLLGAPVHDFFKHLCACIGVDYYVADGLDYAFQRNLYLSSPEHDRAIADLLSTLVSILESDLSKEFAQDAN